MLFLFVSNGVISPFSFCGCKGTYFYYKYCIFSHIYSYLLPLQPKRKKYVKKETRTAHY